VKTKKSSRISSCSIRINKNVIGLEHPMKGTPILACASLLAVVGPGTAAKATVISDNQIKADLKAAICEQDWQDAITFSSRLMASSTITPEHRQELVTWRHRFSQYAAGGTYFDHIPNCEGYATYQGPKPADIAAAQAAAEAAAAAAARASAERIKADLKTAICLQDWQSAVALSSQLMASSTITAEHRQELVKWRYQFTQYAASGTVFSEIPNCGYNSSPDPKGESVSLPQSAPQSTPLSAHVSTPQSTPSAHVSTPLSTPLNSPQSTPQSASLSAPLNSPQSIPLRASLNTPQSASLLVPQSTPVAPARVTAAPSAPRPTAALPDATCYITYSDGRTVNLESMCQ
jgi:hypothetical protein